MDSDEMPAGRELDALVATKIMGWRTAHFDASYGEWLGVPLDDYWEDVPRYSTDIAAAWLVVKRMCSFIGVDDDLWGRFVDEMNTAHDYAISDFLSHASPLIICRCALAAFRTAT